MVFEKNKMTWFIKSCTISYYKQSIGFMLNLSSFFLIKYKIDSNNNEISIVSNILVDQLNFLRLYLVLGKYLEKIGRAHV